MTQLDRLEALAEKWQKQGLLARETKIAHDALPDLIRVARAASRIRPDSQTVRNWHELDSALAPLFAEVES